MIIIKLKNFRGMNGVSDYKGLDLSEIVPGSQIYPDNEDVAYFYYNKTVTPSGDISVITQGDYDGVKTAMDNKPKPVTDADRITELETIIFEAMIGGKL